MKFTDIKDLSRAELLKKRDGLRADMFQAKMKNGLGQLANPVQIRFMRRDLARLETVLASNKETPARAAVPATKKVAVRSSSRTTHAKKSPKKKA